MVRHVERISVGPLVGRAPRNLRSALNRGSVLGAELHRRTALGEAALDLRTHRDFVPYRDRESSRGFSIFLALPSSLAGSGPGWAIGNEGIRDIARIY